MPHRLTATSEGRAPLPFPVGRNPEMFWFYVSVAILDSDRGKFHP